MTDASKTSAAAVYSPPARVYESEPRFLSPARLLPPFIFALVAVGLPARAQIAVVSAASYQPVVAPDSLASLFGSGLANSTATATLDPNGNLPTKLAGVSVEINATPAPLLYVSPGQINFLVPATTDPGSAGVLVRTPSGSALQGSLQVRQVAPALFSRDASGTGPGAILNAATFTGPPFLVETLQNSGDDKRTRLAVFATGLRFAGNPSQNPNESNVAVQVQARDSSGNSYNVEYAGSAPGFFGLDQINLTLPPELDGAGVISLAITADNFLSNTVTFTVASLPATQLHLASLTLSQSSTIAGDSVPGTVTLNGRARFGGYSVNLSASGLGVQVPPSITVPENAASANFSISAGGAGAAGAYTITASAGGLARTAVLQVYPVNTPTLTGLSLGAASVTGGDPVTGTLSLSGNAPLGGVTVQLASSNPDVQVPAGVSLSFGRNSAAFTATTSPVTTTETATITASFAGSTSRAMLSLGPALALTLQPAAVVGGNSVTAAVSLAAPAPANNAAILLQSSDRLLAPVPPSVTIPAGQLSASFAIAAAPVTSPRTVIITATYGKATESASLAINPLAFPTPASLTLNPTFVLGGTSSTGTVTLTGPAPPSGLLVDLQSDQSFIARVPRFITVAPGQTSATFPITTSSVSSTLTVTITASAGGVSQSAMLTIQ